MVIGGCRHEPRLWTREQENRKRPILMFGALCFLSVVLPFLAVPNVERWSGFWSWCMRYGTGRLHLKDTQSYLPLLSIEKEGAFATNIILQNRLSVAITEQ
jgi:hypothetical protein